MRAPKLLSRLVRQSKHDGSVAMAPYPSVNVFEWRPKSGAINFGDHLSTVVVSKLLSDRGRSLWEETAQDRRLFAVGSVLHFTSEGDTIWGSGVNGKIPNNAPYPKFLDIRAVRGPLTAQFLHDRGHDVPEVFGDPALLLPHLFPNRFHVEKKVPALFIPNLHDLMSLDDCTIPIASPLRGWNWVADRIAEAEFVLASSLHGIIIAEALGIPARYVRLSELEGMFKYDDYARGTGRECMMPAFSVAEGLEMGGHDPIEFDQNRLLQAFPWDLWGST